MIKIVMNFVNYPFTDLSANNGHVTISFGYGTACYRQKTLSFGILLKPPEF